MNAEISCKKIKSLKRIQEKKIDLCKFFKNSKMHFTVLLQNQNKAFISKREKVFLELNFGENINLSNPIYNIG